MVFLSSSGSSSGSSPPEPEGAFGVEGGGGPPGEGFPDGNQPPPRPQSFFDGQRSGIIQPPLLPPPELLPEPQISLNTQPHARVGFEPFEVVMEVPV